MRKAVMLFCLLSWGARGAPPPPPHDFWIEPSTFRPEAGAAFTTALRVGENFEGEPVPRRSPRIESFVVRDAGGERAVPGIENRDPAGVLRLDGQRAAVIGYRSRANPHELPAAKFAQFLKEEGVRGIEPGSGVQRERFYRFAKSIVNRGEIDTRFGWRFELVRNGDRFQLLYEQRPLRGALVTAISRGGKRVSARTDAEGLVRFDLAPGVWLVKATHVVAAPENSGFDWDSLWASLTLEI